jgi:uncharacterized protein (TIGR02391 family)
VEIGTKPMKLSRVEDDGTVTTVDISGDDHGSGKVYFKVDADVEVGDELSHVLPNGKTRTFRITEVIVHEAPRGFSSSLDHTECVYEVVNARAAIRQPPPVALPGMHPLISQAAGSKVASRHYDNAVFDAFKAVEDRVQALTGDGRSGAKLMGGVFDTQKPLLDITSDNAGDAQKADEREGFKFLFMGASIGLRNTRGHGADLKTAEQEAMTMLATASLLMSALDRAEKRQPPKPVKKIPPRSPVPRGFAGGQQ